MCFTNYIDLRFKNPTNQPFQIKVWVTNKHLKWAIYTDKEWRYAYHIEERNHTFMKQNDKIYRKNEIWRKVVDKKTGNYVDESLLMKNFSEVKYEVTDEKLI